MQFRNLTENALKYAPGSPVDIAVRSEANDVVLDVTRSRSRHRDRPNKNASSTDSIAGAKAATRMASASAWRSPNARSSAPAAS